MYVTGQTVELNFILKKGGFWPNYMDLITTHPNKKTTYIDGRNYSKVGSSSRVIISDEESTHVSEYIKPTNTKDGFVRVKIGHDAIGLWKLQFVSNEKHSEGDAHKYVIFYEMMYSVIDHTPNYNGSFSSSF